ncbi:unnamed protein product [Paramecium sonneborni]|uniref:Uncharacterized protein n=1 Tax=Paramecium sonneborni TaxID=65129 RepID=A0A8S1Q7J3_9CILI|nr:unnamed protein product [Paramecium sonneborni]
MHQSVLECQFERHHKSQIIGVCVNKLCQNKRPFCVGCQYQFHKDHLNDLKFFDDLNDWVLQNSQPAADLTTYLNELIELVKSISQLIEATQQANQHSNFNQMSYTNLENSINNLMNLWSCQKSVLQLLQGMLSIKIKNQIKQLCTFQFSQQIIVKNIQINPQQIQQYQNVTIKQTQRQNTQGFNVLEYQNAQQSLEQIPINQAKPFREPCRVQNNFQNGQYYKNQQNFPNRSISPRRNDVQNVIQIPQQINNQNKKTRY